jgi:hypothetical protein
MKFYQNIYLLITILLVDYCKSAGNQTQNVPMSDLVCDHKENCTSGSFISSENSLNAPPPAIRDMIEYDIEQNSANLKPKSRKKRYVIFPEGSSFSVAVCMTIGLYGNPNYQFVSWALNWGVAYELPNNATEFTRPLGRLKRSMPRPIVQREHRRNLFGKMEIAMNDMGYNGRECILRAICESSQFFSKKGSNLIEELLRTVFSLPKTKLLPFEHKDLFQYDTANRRGLTKGFCTSFYPNCGFSIIDLALGRYKNPDFNYM